MIKKIQWDDSYLLGISKIDDQHKELLSIINELYDATQQEYEVYHFKLASIFEKLKDYTIYHFGDEKKLMAKYGCIILNLHTMQHTGFICEVSKQMEELADSMPEDGLEFYSYLCTWVISHIAEADKLWSLFVLPKMKAEAQKNM